MTCHQNPGPARESQLDSHMARVLLHNQIKSTIFKHMIMATSGASRGQCCDVGGLTPTAVWTHALCWIIMSLLGYTRFDSLHSDLVNIFKTENRCLGTKKYIFLWLMNLEVQCRVYKDSPIISILTRFNPILRIDTYFFKIHSKLSSHLRLGLPKGIFPVGLN